MFAPGDRVGVGVSGGADSVALALLLQELTEWKLNLTVLHLNHNLRATDSDADEEFVRALAAQLDLPVVCHSQDVASAGGNLEESAREARLSFFRSAAEAHGLKRIAVGHTRSDQAETVLFRLLRGSYTTGLAGIRPVTEAGIVRPLLFVEHAELEAYLRERGIAWREDRSNQDQRFARNRIRHQLLPQLTADWNPQLPEILANHAVLAQDDDMYWESQVSAVLGGLPSDAVQVRGEATIVDLRAFQHLPPAILRRVFRRMISSVKGDLRQIDFRHIDQIMQLAEIPEGHGRVQIPGVDAMRSFHWIRLAPPLAGPAERNFSFQLSPPAVIPVPGSDRELACDITVRYPGGFAHDTINKEKNREEDEVVLDWDRVPASPGSGLEMRNWRPGDRYQPAGHQNEQKVKTLFHDAQVPLWDRRNWPIICLGDNILWARRFGGDVRYAPGADSVRVLRISERKRI